MGGYNNRFTPYDVRDRGGNRGVGGGIGGNMGGPRNDYDNNRGMGGGNRKHIKHLINCFIIYYFYRLECRWQ